MLKRKLKSVGATMHSCLVPLVTRNSSLSLPLTNHAPMPSWKHLIIFTILEAVCVCVGGGGWMGGFQFGEVCSIVPGVTLCRKPWWGWQRGCRDPYFVPHISLGSVLEWISCRLSFCSGENHTGFLALSQQEKSIQRVQDDLGEDLACNASKDSHDSWRSWSCHLCIYTDALFWHLSDLGVKSHPPSTYNGTHWSSVSAADHLL